METTYSIIAGSQGATLDLREDKHGDLKRFGDRAFCAYAPRLWNELLDNIKAADSVQNFKTQLKTIAISKGSWSDYMDH